MKKIELYQNAVDKRLALRLTAFIALWTTGLVIGRDWHAALTRRLALLHGAYYLILHTIAVL